MTEKLSVFVPISKVDEEKQEVWGVLTAAVPDRQGEILDYQKSKPHFQEWSDSQKDASGGKSLGNVRLMHGKQAIGKVIQIDYDDAGEKISIGAKITDRNAFEMAKEGVLTGYSVGGSYEGPREEIQHEKLGKLLRYVAKPQEASLVDRPAVPTATFTMVKADGTSEERPLVGRQVEQVWACHAAEGCTHQTKAEALKCDGSEFVEKREFSDKERKKLAESGAAMPGGGYPIENSGDLKNAIQAFGRAKDKAKTKAHIKARAKALGLTDELPKDWKKFAQAPLRKCLYQIAQLASVIQGLEYIQEAEEYEAAREGDDSEIPAKLSGIIGTLYEALIQMAEEEAQEASEDDGEDEMPMAAFVTSLLQKINEPDRLRQLLEKRADKEEIEMKPEEFQKIVGAQTEAVMKAVSEGIEKLEKGFSEKLAKVTDEIEAIKKVVPAPTSVKKSLHAASKEGDTKDETENPEVKKDASALDLIKESFRHPLLRA